jgi:hypothetical protein
VNNITQIGVSGKVIFSHFAKGSWKATPVELVNDLVNFFLARGNPSLIISAV